MLTIWTHMMIALLNHAINTTNNCGYAGVFQNSKNDL